MAKALDEQRRADAAFDALCFEDRFGFLAERGGKRMTARLRLAALRQAACVKNFDGRSPTRHRPGNVGPLRELRIARSE